MNHVYWKNEKSQKTSPGRSRAHFWSEHRAYYLKDKRARENQLIYIKWRIFLDYKLFSIFWAIIPLKLFLFRSCVLSVVSWIPTLHRILDHHKVLSPGSSLIGSWNQGLHSVLGCRSFRHGTGSWVFIGSWVLTSSWINILENL